MGCGYSKLSVGLNDCNPWIRGSELKMPISVEHPIAYYGALSAALGTCLYLFVVTGRRLESLRQRLEVRISEAERGNYATGTQLAAFETRLGNWAGKTSELEEKVSSIAAIRRPQVLTTGVDANQRTQVLRLARRGDRAEQIAAELRVPKNEVDLLLKVQRAVVRAL